MLIQLKTLSPDLLLGLWQFEIPSPRTMTIKEIERQAEHDLLTAMLGRKVQLEHDANGKPLLDGYHISISHSKTFLAILLSEQHEVGVDIEYQSPRILKIASRFLREDEPYHEDVAKSLCAWCVKEALYKLQSASRLTYQEMRVDVETNRVEDLKNKLSFPFQTYENDDYLLVWLYQ